MWRFWLRRTGRLGLRARTAASYVLVTTAAVLIVEAVLLGLVISSASGSDLVARLQDQAGKDAKILSATAAKLATVSPGDDLPHLLARAVKSSYGLTGFGGSARDAEQSVPLRRVTGKADRVPVEVLLDAQGVIITSTATASYPVRGRLPVRLPTGGQGLGGKSDTAAGAAAWWISPVFGPSAGGTLKLFADGDSVVVEDETGPWEPSGKGNAPQTVGYVYVQAPPDLDEATASAKATVPLLAPGALVLALVVPVGVVFGMLSTRRLIGRITRLAEVTTAVARGDFGHRVGVRGADEVGQLEAGFNRMTERLGAAVEAERRSARADARQAERTRIARELHDSISQDLFSLSLLAAGMRRAAPQELRREAETMERTAARTMREMQALLLELRPVALEDAGLVPALRELCNAYQTRLGITMRASLETVPLTPAAEHAVLRLTQEAVGNAIRHGAPTAIEVRLRRAGGETEIVVSDDGRGFDPSRPSLSHGMGLRLMRERVEELGGRFSVTSGPDAGTVVRASLPVRPVGPPVLAFGVPPFPPAPSAPPVPCAAPAAEAP
ncbi:ATP-binding protein [Sphaerisporangium sp. NPDC005289]|uniref:HAMP domain-containing sensor histidine kinase n=1 Tax=Sphaerisporangium sp. NPDC005289 TaxID=3155247 RepID=UPI0033AD0F74